MRAVAVVFVAVALLLTGCSNTSGPSEERGVVIRYVVTGDFDDALIQFTDYDGELTTVDDVSDAWTWTLERAVDSGQQLILIADVWDGQATMTLRIYADGALVAEASGFGFDGLVVSVTGTS